NALTHIDRALRDEPDDVEMLENKGNALFELGRYEESIPVFEKVIELNPSRGAVYNSLGNAYYYLERYEE
ncbi:MAG: tetratricopeptide repeat protein, partial [Thermoplasmata archaeon]|nr:tetratricopeptide repeat protein [Thermoplasmata archaeon]NIS13784.1 tetratricopeptide repeat protein [Thermoplasmata archaeon]NIS21635.1 tetratricopeptide repeat protein [Thermoplasmata archaeon]NIT79216.1 tetratricopeptide repeat protein [Thermoplasmata archaeon]NIU50665.1 tetratricopeptide repeat protein [Thermoplasmata archaeon]